MSTGNKEKWEWVEHTLRYAKEQQELDQDAQLEGMIPRMITIIRGKDLNSCDAAAKGPAMDNFPSYASAPAPSVKPTTSEPPRPLPTQGPWCAQHVVDRQLSLEKNKSMQFSPSAKEIMVDALSQRLLDLLQPLAEAAEHRLELHKRRFPIELGSNPREALQAIAQRDKQEQEEEQKAQKVREAEAGKGTSAASGSGENLALTMLGVAASSAGDPAAPVAPTFQPEQDMLQAVLGKGTESTQQSALTTGGAQGGSAKVDPMAAPFPAVEHPWRKSARERAAKHKPDEPGQRFPAMTLRHRLEQGLDKKYYTSRRVNVQDLLHIMSQDYRLSSSPLMTKFSLQLERLPSFEPVAPQGTTHAQPNTGGARTYGGYSTTGTPARTGPWVGAPESSTSVSSSSASSAPSSSPSPSSTSSSSSSSLYSSSSSSSPSSSSSSSSPS